MNPFNELPKNTKIIYESPKALNPKPYDKKAASAYTKARLILANGTEFEAVRFLHEINRHSLNNELRRVAAEIRRQEQQQQKRLSALKPINETILETTIAYEQLAVDLTADLATREKNPFVKAQLDFALLEDFDHLYRYANLMDTEYGEKADKLVGYYTEITPGRPTVSEHRHSNDDIRRYINCWQDDLTTRLNTMIITAAEQQTMNYYMNVGNIYPSETGRKLYSEIAMIEEQHVSGYGSLIDPSCTCLESWVMHEYTECYIYFSLVNTETDGDIKRIYELHLEQEINHLKVASDMLYKYEGREWEQLFKYGSEFPDIVKLHENKEYVREVMKRVRNTAVNTKIEDINSLSEGADFFRYQRQAVDVKNMASHNVIEEHIKKFGEDYRYEDKQSTERTLRDRKADNTELGRIKGA